MIAVVVVHIVTVPTGRWRSIHRDRRNRPFQRIARWFIQMTLARDAVFVIILWRGGEGGGSRIKKLLARTDTGTRERKDFQSIRTV